MKYIKTYEGINDGPQVGDYVICKKSSYKSCADINQFLSQNVGYIFKIGINYNIQYEIEIPENIQHFFGLRRSLSGTNPTTGSVASLKSKVGEKKHIYMRRHEILEFSSSKEELESKINAKKYNL